MNKKHEEMKREDATHKLSCRHAIGLSEVNYWMDCIVLKKMPDGRLKIMVFGDRDHEGYEDKKQIRYVDKWRVRPNYHGKS